MISTTLLAATSPVWIAPAMNVHMYQHPAVIRNIEPYAQYGYHFIEPGEGYLACGYVGKGRLEEPETIVSKVIEYFNGAVGKLNLVAKKFLLQLVQLEKKLILFVILQTIQLGKWAMRLRKKQRKKVQM